jgi:hypothetical protein
MTPIESIYEIQSDVLDLQRYLKGKKYAAYYRAYERYIKLVNRFFRENVNVVKPEKRNTCLDDVDYFLKLLEETIQDYQLA